MTSASSEETNCLSMTKLRDQNGVISFSESFSSPVLHLRPGQPFPHVHCGIGQKLVGVFVSVEMYDSSMNESNGQAVLDGDPADVYGGVCLLKCGASFLIDLCVYRDGGKRLVRRRRDVNCSWRGAGALHLRLVDYAKTNVHCRLMTTS